MKILDRGEVRWNGTNRLGLVPGAKNHNEIKYRILLVSLVGTFGTWDPLNQEKASCLRFFACPVSGRRMIGSFAAEKEDKIGRHFSKVDLVCSDQTLQGHLAWSRHQLASSRSLLALRLARARLAPPHNLQILQSLPQGWFASPASLPFCLLVCQFASLPFCLLVCQFASLPVCQQQTGGGGAERRRAKRRAAGGRRPKIN